MYITVQEAAKHLNVCDDTVRKMIREKQLEVIDINPFGKIRQFRILMEDIEKMTKEKAN